MRPLLCVWLQKYARCLPMKGAALSYPYSSIKDCQSSTCTDLWKGSYGENPTGSKAAALIMDMLPGRQHKTEVEMKDRAQTRTGTLGRVLENGPTQARKLESLPWNVAAGLILQDFFFQLTVKVGFKCQSLHYLEKPNHFFKLNVATRQRASKTKSQMDNKEKSFFSTEEKIN